jgi:hypothetical protein
VCRRQVHHRGHTAQFDGSEAADDLLHDRPVLWMRLGERGGWAPRAMGNCTSRIAPASISGCIKSPRWSASRSLGM